MDTVTIDGVEYIKASVLAKKYRYTTDYIGQLCRSKKVDSHLVGRTWYVYPPSLDGHKATRYAELRSDEKKSIKTEKITVSRRVVEPPLPRSADRIQGMQFEKRVVWKPAAYESDEKELVPVPRKEQSVARRMPIRLAGAQSVKVAAVSRNVTLVSEPLPAVALAGTLKVQSYEPQFSDKDDVTVENTGDSFRDAPLSGSPRGATTRHDRRESRQPTGLTEEAESQAHRAHTVIKTASLPKVPNNNRSDVRQPSPVRSQSLFLRLVVVPALVLFFAAATVATFLSMESVSSVAATGNVDNTLRLNASLIASFFGLR